MLLVVLGLLVLLGLLSLSCKHHANILTGTMADATPQKQMNKKFAFCAYIKEVAYFMIVVIYLQHHAFGKSRWRLQCGTESLQKSHDKQINISAGQYTILVTLCLAMRGGVPLTEARSYRMTCEHGTMCLSTCFTLSSSV